MRKIFVCHTFYCPNNVYLTYNIMAFLQKNGFTIVKKPFEADAIIICTCGFDGYRKETALKKIYTYVDRYKEKMIIVTGCLPKICETIGEEREITIISIEELDRFDELFKAKIPLRTIGTDEVNRFFGSSIYYIPISQGCVNFCSYCVIKKAKGFVCSRTPEQIIEDFQKGLRHGFSEFRLLADDCGSYGIDIGTDFSYLLNKLQQSTQHDFKLIISYFEPNRLIHLFPKIDKRVFKRFSYINVPLQSVSQRILKLMNRNYVIDDVLKVVKLIKYLNPHIELVTHIIYCFPRETREEFLATFDLVNYFDKIVYFLYSPNKGTITYGLGGRIPKSEIMYRTAVICQRNKSDRRYVLSTFVKNGNLLKCIEYIKQNCPYAK